MSNSLCHGGLLSRKFKKVRIRGVNACSGCDRDGLLYTHSRGTQSNQANRANESKANNRPTVNYTKINNQHSPIRDQSNQGLFWAVKRLVGRGSKTDMRSQEHCKRYVLCFAPLFQIYSALYTHSLNSLIETSF